MHGHNSQRIEITRNLAIAEVLLLSLDPTEGLMSLFIISFFRNLLDSSYSRTHEEEAVSELDVPSSTKKISLISKS